MCRVNLVRGLGPVLQIAEGWSVNLPGVIHRTLDERTNPTWPTTWFVPTLTGQGAFTDVYSVMNAWGANHGAIEDAPRLSLDHFDPHHIAAVVEGHARFHQSAVGAGLDGLAGKLGIDARNQLGLGDVGRLNVDLRDVGLRRRGRIERRDSLGPTCGRRRRRCGDSGSLGALALGFGGLILGDLFRFFGGEARGLGGLGIRVGLGLRILLRAGGGKLRALLLGFARLGGRRRMGFLCGELLELQLCEAGVKAIGMLREERVEGGLVADLQRKLIVAANIGLRIRRSGGRRGNGRRRHQRHVITAERAIHERFLPAGGRLDHVIAHEAERLAYVEARRGQMP